MKRMLFNATQQEELRVAIVDGQRLIDIDIEAAGREQHKSNIYKAVITRIEPSLEACFVNYGEERHGFLPFKEVARAYFKDGVEFKNASIKTALKEGQEITVQIEKEERGNKGAALTTFISLAGRYLVLMPNNPRGGGVSRRVEGEDRQELRETLDKLEVPQGMSVIARTAGIGRSVEELQWDLNYLLQLWRAIESAGESEGAFLIYHESSLVIRAIRDYFQPDIGEILVDTDEIYDQARQFMSHVMPDMVHRVKRYKDNVPLFSRFQIEHQIETAYSRVVPLPSGGSIVIDHTEALVSIDVNSARSTRGTDIETTAFNTNCEAAEEVARQLRLRDLGGLIVIDFIDMESSRNQREIENRLKDALHLDRARVQMGKISRFGLMELSRQRLRPALAEGIHVTCPRCNGTGHVRDTESSALQILRIIEEEAMKENSAMIHAQMPVDVSAFLLNEKRSEILKIESRHHVRITVIPNRHMETPHYKIERIKHDDPRLEGAQASYTLADLADTDEGFSKRQKEEVKPKQEAVVKSFTPDQPAPVYERPPAPKPDAPKEEGFFSKILAFLSGKPAEPVAPQPVKESRPASSDRSGRGRNRNRRGRDRDDRNAARNAPREEQAKPKLAEATPETAKPARQPRPQRDAGKKPKREPAASTETEVVTAVPVAMTLAAVEVDDTVFTAQPVTDEVGAETATSGETTRRRRRRGGRNRNRRDRDVSLQENNVEVSEEDAEAVSAESLTEADAPASPPVMASATVIEPAAVATEIADKVADEAVVLQVTEVVVRDEPVARPVVATDVAFTAEATLPAEVVAPLDPSPRLHEPDVQADIGASELVVEGPVETAVEMADEMLVQDLAVASFGENPPQPVAALKIKAVNTEPETAAAPMEAVPVPDKTVSHSEPAPAAPSMEAVLSSAGLTLAATDPEKLKAAQEAAQKANEAPRLGRPRKPVQVISAEPLVQVDTRHNSATE